MKSRKTGKALALEIFAKTGGWETNENRQIAVYAHAEHTGYAVCGDKVERNYLEWHIDFIDVTDGEEEWIASYLTGLSPSEVEEGEYPEYTDAEIESLDGVVFSTREQAGMGS